MAGSVLNPRYLDEVNEPASDEQVEIESALRRRRFAPTFDVYLALIVGVLVAIGLMMVWSTTFFWAEPQSALFVQQARNALIGLGVALAFALLDYRLLKRLAIPIMGVTVFLLILVLIIGERVFGAKRTLFSGAVQPSEVAVLAVIIYMAAWLSTKHQKIRYLTYGLLPFTLLVGSVCGLIILEPHLSTAGLIMITASLMFFLAGADWLQIGLTLAGFLIAGLLAISQIDYAQQRLNSFVNLLQDPLTASDHAQNAIIGFLQGGIGGVGLGQGYQKFQSLSAPHTDSIFAVIGEELGLVGCALVIGLFVGLMLRGFKIARSAPDSFGAILAAGITIAIMVEAVFHIAVLASVMPFTGVPLPFISFGGSSLVSSLASIGILISISRASARRTAPTRKVNEMLSLPHVRATISRVRNQVIE